MGDEVGIAGQILKIRHGILKLGNLVKSLLSLDNTSYPHAWQLYAIMNWENGPFDFNWL